MFVPPAPVVLDSSDFDEIIVYCHEANFLCQEKIFDRMTVIITQITHF